MLFSSARQIIIVIVTLFWLVLPSQALTDPEPNPFAALEDEEQVFEGKVLAMDAELLTLRNEDGEDFTGQFDQILKYRNGGGPADQREFAIDDSVRFIGTADLGIVAVQNADLLLCDQNFYGWVRESTNNNFKLETVLQEEYIVNLGLTTQFRDENGELLFGYSPRENDVVRVHGVYNANSRQVFTDTFGAYISLLNEEALAPVLAELETRMTNEEIAGDFTDVAEGYSYRSAVGFVKREGIVAGYPDGTFGPDREINRAEFTKIVVATHFEQSEIEGCTENYFTDVSADAWFAQYVCLAKQEEILNGYPDGTFRPADSVNLAEAVKIIVVNFGWVVDPATGDEAWYAPFLVKAKKLQVLPEDFPEAGSVITRGQMAELVTRAVKYVRGDLVDYLAELEVDESSDKDSDKDSETEENSNTVQ